MPIREKFNKKKDFNLRKKKQKTKIEHKIDELKIENFHNRNLVRDLEKDDDKWRIECQNRQKYNINIKNNFKTQKQTRKINDLFIKKAFSTILNAKTNLYEKIYKLTTTKPEEWENLPFLSTKEKRARFVEIIKQEIIMINSKKFNFAKYKNIICIILTTKNKNFPEIILKNMYIAKLQNICFLLEEVDNNGGNLSDAVEETQEIYR